MKDWVASLIDVLYIISLIYIGSKIFMFVAMNSLDNYLYKKFKSYTKKLKENDNKEKKSE